MSVTESATEFAAEFVSEPTRTLILPVQGMTCAACAATIERALDKLPGVRASVNFAAEKVRIEYQAARATPAQLVERIEKAGFSIPAQSTTLEIGGMSCAACATTVERVLNRLPGVAARVNFASARAQVDYPPGLVDVERLIGAVEKAGFTATPGADLEAAQAARALRDQALWRQQWRRCLLAVPLTLPLLLQMAFMFADGAEHSRELPRGAQWLLATPVQFWAGAHFYRAAWNALRGGAANMDVLVALGTSAAYFYSVWAWLAGGHHVYFEASAAIITLVLLGRLLEARAKRKTSSAIQSLLQLSPKTAHIERDGQIVEVPAASLRVGDLFIVGAGEAVAVDGVVTQGRSSIDEAMLTGESMPVAKEEGDAVHAATINQNGLLRVRATGIGEATLLAQIIRMVDEAQGSKAPIQHLADRVAAVFVPVVVLIALLTLGLTWAVTGVFSTALVHAVSVLVIACPCSLGLATPTALMVGAGVAARRGILIRNAEVIERARGLRALVVDKTGTLTHGKPAITEIITARPEDETRLIAWAAALEAGSSHPLARAITRRAREQQLPLPAATDLETVPGKGIGGQIEGRRVLLGAPDWLAERPAAQPLAAELATRIASARERGHTIAALSVEGDVLGALALADPLRETSAQAVRDLQRQGVDVVMLTGDNPQTAQGIARQCGISRYRAQVLPQDKAAEVRRLQQEFGPRVGMAGDGINDAPALAAADLSFAIGGGSDIAVNAADVVLVHGDLRHVAQAVDISAATLRKIRQNLFFAFFYNALGIPLAAFGLLNPVAAGAAMALSSISVVSNSLLLNRWRPAAARR
ncbi:MAG: heavy metal translocating P-type ATPase, partial [Candidatus Accumulibacter sp.]|nr:heavy metal translocating P-type ATPase [Accumulibacter sp.]